MAKEHLSLRLLLTKQQKHKEIKIQWTKIKPNQISNTNWWPISREPVSNATKQIPRQNRIRTCFQIKLQYRQNLRHSFISRHRHPPCCKRDVVHLKFENWPYSSFNRVSIFLPSSDWQTEDYKQISYLPCKVFNWALSSEIQIQNKTIVNIQRNLKT